MFNLITTIEKSKTMAMHIYRVYGPVFVFSDVGKDKQ